MLSELDVLKDVCARLANAQIGLIVRKQAPYRQNECARQTENRTCTLK
jgi:hypothetical protein